MKRFQWYVMGSVLTAGLLGLAHDAYGEAPEEELSMHSQCKLSLLKGSYVYANTGFVVTGAERIPFAQAGRDVFRGDGTLTGSATVNTNGVSSRIVYSGTYTLDSNCRGTAKTTDNTGVTDHFDFFVTKNGETLAYVQTDPGYVTATFEVRRDD
ncbi:hypothetical protein [Corallococcus carmarthensis]|uniref:Uncharacterized protein n=1 Tax=Corallococcus carmarthensis TaxID=2316728 RepID=A0A3A8K8T6_9BACT|nr:hypothetical protein [Corallococcus carmarthensis]NOK16355.1 hypothetical protein [Corallococcus carmarthensis]RKH00571.1 hypothetical protein D7X32_23130 [Corallococcus carmarthensis]